MIISEIANYLKQIIENNYKISLKSPILFSEKFQQLLIDQDFNHNEWFKDKPILLDKNNEPDYLGTCFYMINSLQEYADNAPDRFGRFQYKNSFQAKFNCVEENLVDRYIRTYLNNHDEKLPELSSKVFISHDIDLLHGGFKQDTAYLLKNMKLVDVLKYIYSYVFGARSWKNIDNLLKIETEADIKATFYWIVQNRFDSKSNIQNSDYLFTDSYVIKTQKKIQDCNLFQNGLHKSSFSDISFDDEILRFKNDTITTNRNHYLKFKLPEHYQLLNKSALHTDCSLGFYETIGFRNSFGLPFQPYNFNEKKAFNFLEIPLNIMDTSFIAYQDFSIRKMDNQIIDFIENNKKNTVISMLWHNDKLTKLKFNEILVLFKKIVTLIKESKLETVTPAELYADYVN